MNSSVKDGVVTLSGREFKRVKTGLDEAQVASFVDELIRERDKLAKSQHHVASLTKLAETTIVEADRLANQIKAEASEQAKAESAAVLGKAREEARLVAEQKQAEVLKTAHEEAAAIRAEAEKKAAALLEGERARIHDALRNVIAGQFGCVLQELDRLKKQAAAAQMDFEKHLSRSGYEGSVIAASPREEIVAAPMGAREERGTAIVATKNEGAAAPVKEDRFPDEHLQKGQATQSEQDFDLSRLLEMEDRAELGDPQFEVEILPPVHMRKMMEVVAYLDELPEVENTEIIPRVDMPAILVFLREEINFLEVLRAAPGVAHIEEVSTDAGASNGGVGKEPKKVRIGLSGNTMLQEKA
jgi:cell division septum initiation protein DivIVA